MRCVCLPFTPTPEDPYSDVDPSQPQTLSTGVNESGVPGHYGLRSVKNVSLYCFQIIYIYIHTYRDSCIHIHT